MQERHRAGLRDGGRRRDWGRTPGRRSSPADSPRSCGWESRWAPRARRWRVWPASATSSRRARRRSRVTARSANGSARGDSLEAAQLAAGGHVAEGVTSCESVLALAASYDVEMPLTDAVHRVCHKGSVGRRSGRAAARAAAPNRSDAMDGPVRRFHPQRESRWLGSGSGRSRWHRLLFRPPTYHLSPDETSRWTATAAARIPPGGNWNRRLAELEGATAALTFGSGMAAITSALRALAKPGTTLVVPADGYYQVRRYAVEYLAPQGITVIEAQLRRHRRRGVGRRRGARRDARRTPASTSSTCIGWR